MALPWMTPEIKREEEDNPYLAVLETVKNVATGYGPAEVALSMVSGLPSFIVGGMHQGVEAVAPGLPEKIGLKQASEFLARPEITYQPKTQAGQALQRTMALPFELARETGPKVADWVREKTGSPLLATGAGTAVSGAPEILMGILGLKAMAKGPSPYPVTPPGLITRMPEGAKRPVSSSSTVETLGVAQEANPYEALLEKPQQKNALTEPESRVNVAQKNIMETPEFSQEVRHYMPPSEWMKVPELSRDAQLAAKKIGVKPESLEYVGLQKFTPYSQDAMHMWQVVDETSPFFQSTIAGPTFQVGRGISKLTKVTPDEFIMARDASTRPYFLTPYTKEELKNFDLRLNQEGVGYALTPQKDLVNVFNNSGVKGAGVDAVIQAIKDGAKTLDCFDGFLPEYYKKFGFVEIKRSPWNPEYAPMNWPVETYGTPDVVYMQYKGGRNVKELKRIKDSIGGGGIRGGARMGTSSSGTGAGIGKAKGTEILTGEQGRIIGTMEAHLPRSPLDVLKSERGSLGEPAPVWYSALQRTIEQKMPNSAY
jgi:hypothetical protein